MAKSKELLPCRHCRKGLPVATGYESRKLGYWFSYSCYWCEFTSESCRTQDEAIALWNKANARIAVTLSIEQMAMLASALHQLPKHEDPAVVHRWFSEYRPMLRTVITAILHSLSPMVVCCHHLLHKMCCH